MSSWLIVGDIKGAQTFAQVRGIRELNRLVETYGGSHWRKRKGFAQIRLMPSGVLVDAEIHWYEAHGVGKVEMKIKELL